VKTFRVRNLEKWQHYGDRTPPWIKLHVVLLANYDFARLPDASKAHAMSIMLLASQNSNSLPWDPAWIGSKINATTKVNLEVLVTAGVIEVKQDASDSLADREQSACVDKRRVDESEMRSEENRSGIPECLKTKEFFDAWQEWEAYRVEIKKKITPTSEKGQLAMLAKLGSSQAVEAIRTSIRNGWTGVFEPKSNGQNGHGKPTKTNVGHVAGADGGYFDRLEGKS